jgi:hypothetical protein
MFQHDFPELILEITPFVPGTALNKALQQNKIAKVKLLRYEKPSDVAAQGIDKWGKPQGFARVQVEISMRGRGQMLGAKILKKYTQGDQAAQKEIFEFAGMEFEQVKVVADVGGRERTFNLQNLEAGHPMAIDINPKLGKRGEPNEDSLVEELREALNAAK